MRGARAVITTALLACAACAPVASVDDAGAPGHDAGSPSLDGGAARADAGPPAPPDGGGTFTDAGYVDAGLFDAGFVDAGFVDGGLLDAGPADAGFVDAGSSDAGRIDAGSIDAGSIDAGSIDAGSIDAGSIDAGSIDAGSMDAGSIDAGVDDAGPGVDGGSTVDGGAGRFVLRSSTRIGGTANDGALIAVEIGAALFVAARVKSSSATVGPLADPSLSFTPGGPSAVVARLDDDSSVPWVLTVRADDAWAPRALAASASGAVLFGGQVLADVSPAAVFAPGRPDEIACPMHNQFAGFYAAQATVDGTMEWAHCWTNFGAVEAMIVGTDGSVFVLGDIWAQTGERLHEAGPDGGFDLPDEGNGSIVLIKLAPDGAFQWALRPGDTFGYALGGAAMGDGTLVVAGTFTASTNIVDREGTVHSLSGRSEQELFFMRITEDGVVVDLQAVGGPLYIAYDGAFARLDDGRFALTSGVRPDAVFPADGGPGSATSYDGVVLAFDDAFRLDAITGWSSTGWITTGGLAADGAGGCIVAGGFDGVLALADGEHVADGRDGFLAHLDGCRTLDAFVAIGGPGDDELSGLSVRADGRAVATGYYGSSPLPIDDAGSSLGNAGDVDGACLQFALVP